MSQLCFVAVEAYRQIVIQLGEQPDRVFLVGDISIDNIKRLQLLDRAVLEALIDFKLDHKNLLVTFHPVTLEAVTAENQMEELLASFAALKDTQLIFTLPNADTDGRALIKMMEKCVARHPNARAYTSLG
jgi:GDP/UDP-N,N'-diacetylbacillosamine 2-epimerase (hydrolysing)